MFSFLSILSNTFSAGGSLSMIISLAVVLVAVVLVVLAAFMIPAIIEVRKTAAAIREFTTYTESELKPVLQELHQTLSDLKEIADVAATGTEDVRSFVTGLGEMGRHLRTINHVVGGVAGVLAGSSAWITGARVASRFIMDRVSKKRGGE
jgi:uncharacterized protein YoxC